MPRSLSTALRRVLERSNPLHAVKVELSAPDVGQVLRRPDQWNTPAAVASGSAAYTTDERGALTLAAHVDRLASIIPTGTYPTGYDNGSWNLDAYDPSLRLKAAALVLDPAFDRVRLRSVTARITRPGPVFGGLYIPMPLSLQIFRAVGVPGSVRTAGPVTTVVDGKTLVTFERPFIQWSFVPVLSEPFVLPAAAQPWGNTLDQPGNLTVGNIPFDLSNYGVILDQSAKPSDSAYAAAWKAEYYFVIQPARGFGQYAIRTHTASGAGAALDGFAPGTHTTPGVGTIQTVWWERDNTNQEWRYTHQRDEAPLIALDVDTYPGTAVLDYDLDVGRAPLAGTIGRVVFERTEPRGAAAGLSISTNGGATFGPTYNENPAPAAQQTFRTRLVLQPSADHFSAPRVSALGIEFRTPYDVSPESTVTFPAHEVAAPTLVPAIADASVQVLRLGRRDYADLPTQLATTTSPALLECDIYIGSDHPSVPRSEWLRLERMGVNTRDGDGTAETYPLLSLQKQLKRKVPRRIETINTALTVASGSTTERVHLTTPLDVPALVGSYPGVGFGPYYALGYYVEVRSSATVPVGTIYTIADNEGQFYLHFEGSAFPAAPAAGDVLVLHSGRKALAPIVWQNRDPADVQLELITLHAEIPRERVGRNDVRNGGLPPSVLLRAPGDAARQAALTVTRQVSDETEVEKLLNALAFLCGGAWLDVGGQLCFIQLYPLRDASGAVTVPLGSSVATFGPQDYSGLRVPSGLASRQTEVSVDYGVNTAAASPDATPTQTVSFVDADALAWHTHQDLEDAGTAKVADDVSKWLYNSADSGLALAVDAARQQVLATSTGLRLWSFTTREPRFDLLPGDVVTLVTDTVTDYDPATRAQVKGWTAFTGVLVKVQHAATGGTALTLFVQGLPGNAVRVTGGPAAISGGASALIAVPDDVRLTLNTLTTETGGNPSFAVTFTRPASPFFDHMKYRVERKGTTDADYAPTYIVPGERAANDVIPADWDATYRVTPVTVSSAGTESVGAALAPKATGRSPLAAITILSVVREATAIVLTYSYNVPFSFAEVWTKEYASDPGTVVSVERASGAVRFPSDVNADPRFTTIRLPVTSGNWLAITLVPANAYNARNAAGIVTVVAQSDTGATVPSAPTSAVPASHTATSVTTTVTPSTTGALRPYLSGAPYGPDLTGVTAGTPVSVLHTGLSPATAYAFEYASVSAAGIESTARTAAGSVTTDAATLVTPTIASDGYDEDLQGYYVTVTNATSEPASTTYHLFVGGIERTSSTSDTLFRARAQPPGASDLTETVTVTASAPLYGTSSASSALSVTIPHT